MAEKDFRVSRVFTDSCASLPRAIATRYNIGVVPAIVNVDTIQYHEGIDLFPEQLLSMLPGLVVLPTTAAPAPGEFIQAYQTADPDSGIISVHVASQLSGILNSALVASHEPGLEGRVSVFDSQTVSIGIGFMAIRAAELIEQGATREQVLVELEDLRKRTTVIASLATLEYLEKGGRAPKIVTNFGTILNIKPIIKIGDNRIDPVEIPRSLKRSHERLVELTADRCPLERVAVMHAGAEDQAKAIAEQIKRFYDGDIVVGDIGAVLLVHGGPGIVGVCSVQEKK